MRAPRARACGRRARSRLPGSRPTRSEEHTSELQSLAYLVCRLLLEKKKKITEHLDNATRGSKVHVTPEPTRPTRRHPSPPSASTASRLQTFNSCPHAVARARPSAAD